MKNGHQKTPGWRRLRPATPAAAHPDRHFLERDLPLVLGRRPGAVCIDAGAHDGSFIDQLRRCLPRQ